MTTNELREKVARVLDREGAQTGECGHEPGDLDECESGCRKLLLRYADALLPIFAEVRAQAIREARGAIMPTLNWNLRYVIHAVDLSGSRFLHAVDVHVALSEIADRIEKEQSWVK